MVTQTLSLAEQAAEHANTAGLDFLSYPGARVFFPHERGYDATGTALLRGTRHDGTTYLFADGSWVRWSSHFSTTASATMHGSWYAGQEDRPHTAPSPLPAGLCYARGAWQFAH
jgi:hypothetical protein